MEGTNITELSEIDILQLQFNILEELKQKKTNNSFNQDMSANEFISKRFKDTEGIYESNKCYAYRQIWFQHGCCSYRKLGEIVGKSHVTMQQIANRFNWHIIKERAFDLGYVPNSYDDFKSVGRTSKEYQRYHEKILRRDKVCQCCGSSEDLEVHHPLPFKKYNSLAADINNGIVLCKKCHTEYHSQNGYKRNCNPVSLAQFLRDYAKPFQSNLQSSSQDVPKIYLIDHTSEKMKYLVKKAHHDIKSFEQEHGLCSKEMLMSELKKEISEDEVEFLIKNLLQKGLIYSPEPEHYKTVD